MSLTSAIVEGQLNLSGARLLTPGGVALRGTDLSVRGSLLARELEVRGGVNLIGAVIGGSLSLQGSELREAAGPALEARWAEVGRDLDCSGASFDGQVMVRDSSLGGSLDFTGATVANPDGCALNAERIRSGSVFLRRGFRAEGEVLLRGARIRGQLSCWDGRFDHPAGPALNAFAVSVEGHVFLNKGFRARGSVLLNDARIAASLYCIEGEFEAPRDDAAGARSVALDLSATRIENDARCAHVRVQGLMRLTDASIRGYVNLTGARLLNPGGVAVDAERLEAESLFLRDGFTSHGGFRLQGAKLRGQLSCVGGRLENDEDYALRARALSTGGNVVLTGGFCALGGVDLSEARISGQVSCRGATLVAREEPPGTARERASGRRARRRSAVEGPPGVVLDPVTGGMGTERIALTLWRASADRIDMRSKEVRGYLNLAGARTDAYVDWRDAWPVAVGLSGFQYRRMRSVPELPDWRDRLDWLALNVGGFADQPYDQFRAALRDNGQEDRARDVYLEKRRIRRRTLNWRSRAFEAILDATLGYGYRPLRIAYWLIGIFVAAWVAFAEAHPRHFEAAKDDPVDFDAALYAAERLVPVLRLDQAASWAAEGYAAWVAFGVALAGWLATALVVATVTGVIRRD